MAGTSVPYWALVVEVALAAPLHLGCERCYAGEASTTMTGEQTPVSRLFFIVIRSYSVVVFLLLLFLRPFYCYSKLFCYIWAALLRRRGLNYYGRADARLSVGSLIFLPIRGDMTHLEPTLFRIFLSRDSNRHNWDAVSSFWESF